MNHKEIVEQLIALAEQLVAVELPDFFDIGHDNDGVLWFDMFGKLLTFKAVTINRDYGSSHVGIFWGEPRMLKVFKKLDLRPADYNPGDFWTGRYDKGKKTVSISAKVVSNQYLNKVPSELLRRLQRKFPDADMFLLFKANSSEPELV